MLGWRQILLFCWKQLYRLKLWLVQKQTWSVLQVKAEREVKEPKLNNCCWLAPTQKSKIKLLQSGRTTAVWQIVTDRNGFQKRATVQIKQEERWVKHSSDWCANDVPFVYHMTTSHNRTHPCPGAHTHPLIFAQRSLDPSIKHWLVSFSFLFSIFLAGILRQRFLTALPTFNKQHSFKHNV